MEYCACNPTKKPRVKPPLDFDIHIMNSFKTFKAAAKALLGDQYPRVRISTTQSANSIVVTVIGPYLSHWYTSIGHGTTYICVAASFAGSTAVYPFEACGDFIKSLKGHKVIYITPLPKE